MAAASTVRIDGRHAARAHRDALGDEDARIARESWHHLLYPSHVQEIRSGGAVPSGWHAGLRSDAERIQHSKQGEEMGIAGAGHVSEPRAGPVYYAPLLPSIADEQFLMWSAVALACYCSRRRWSRMRLSAVMAARSLISERPPRKCWLVSLMRSGVSPAEATAI